MTDFTLDQIASRCDKVRWQGKDSFTACCVAHDDRNPSMTVTEAEDGKILAHCFSGCDQQSVLERLGLWREKSIISGTEIIKTSRKIADTVILTAPTEARAKRAVELSTPAPCNHSYLIKKGIRAHGIGVLGELHRDLPGNVRNKGNVLVIPMQDVNGKVLSCQFIAEDGSKAYLAGKKRKGGFYYIQGRSLNFSDRLWICEGFATGASLHEDTGDGVACAFDAGGLMPVTGALTALYPNRTIILMADDDWETDGNPGATKASAAAQVNGIKVLQPDFTGMDRGQKDTDFNDMVRLRNG